jgi:hypothetical protein
MTYETYPPIKFVPGSDSQGITLSSTRRYALRPSLRSQTLNTYRLPSRLATLIAIGPNPA